MPNAPIPKIHIGLISTTPGRDFQVKEALNQFGGGYVHTAKDHLDMTSKLDVQRIDLLLIDCQPNETGAQIQALVSYFRKKKIYETLPMGILHPKSHFELKTLITDSRIRAFPQTMGLTLILSCLIPIMQNPGAKEAEPLPQDWIQTEFLNSILLRIGNQTQLTPKGPSDDDLHTSFLVQTTEEIRTSLAWVKVAARILEREEAGFSKLFAAGDSSVAEEIGINILHLICTDFKDKLHAELSTRGALFFPSTDQLPPHDRKLLFSNSKTQNFLFETREIAILLEMIRYL